VCESEGAWYGLGMENASENVKYFVGLAISIGCGVMGLSKPEYRWLATICFVLAGISLGGVGFMWLVQTSTPLWQRVGAGLGIGCVVFVVLPLLTRGVWPDVAHAQTPDSAASSPPNGEHAMTGSITTNNQSGGINNTGTMTINQEDQSVKRRMRDLFNLIDPAILPTVASGQLHIVVRMQPFEISKLQSLITEGGSTSPVSITGYGVTMRDSVIINGTLGPARAVPVQQQVSLNVDPGLLK
jgi:hypothetical protein